MGMSRKFQTLKLFKGFVHDCDSHCLDFERKHPVTFASFTPFICLHITIEVQ